MCSRDLSNNVSAAEEIVGIWLLGFIKLEVQKMAWNVDEKKGEARKTPTGKVVEIRSPGKDAHGVEKLRADLDKERDLASGMEVLELDFMLGVVENTRGDDKNDVMMRKLVFNELLRRQQLDTIDSTALKVYAVDDSNLYGKDIQCEAMKKLTERTLRKSKASAGYENPAAS